MFSSFRKENLFFFLFPHQVGSNSLQGGGGGVRPEKEEGETARGGCRLGPQVAPGLGKLDLLFSTMKEGTEQETLGKNRLKRNLISPHPGLGGTQGSDLRPSPNTGF